MAAYNALSTTGQGPPPVTWQKDVLRTFASYDGAAQGSGYGGSRFREVESLLKAYSHVRAVVAGGRTELPELYDLLLYTRSQETYQTYIAGWPSLLRPLSSMMADMPTMVQEKYASCQSMCFCGLFPALGRAWASIDNSLFLWRYDRGGDIPLEYNGEEQAICAVGLLQPRAGVFLEAIQHVIVLCTTVEVVLLGVCPARQSSSGSSGDVTLQPLPMYCVPTDNVVMSCVSCSAGGRVFLGGADGHVYELNYNALESWRSKRISKVRITSSIQQYLPRFIPSLLRMGAAPPIVSLALDDQRHCLYSLSENSAIQLFDLGATGTDLPRKAAEVTDVHAVARTSVNGGDVFRGDRKSPVLKHISPIAISESDKLHMVAVTADGRRIYFSTQDVRQRPYSNAAYATPQANARPAAAGSRSTSGSSPGGKPYVQRPAVLQAVFSRAALPATASGRGITDDSGRASATNCVTAHYAAGTLLLAEMAGSDGRTTRLKVSACNSTIPQVALNTTAANSSHGLREWVAEADNFIPGEACAMSAVPSRSVLGSDAAASGNDELSTQIFTPAPRFVLISTAGTMEVERRRPVDVLASILEERSPEKLRSFFDIYGAVEAAAMCYILATAAPGELGLTGVSSGAVPSVIRGAVAALDNVLLVGEACASEDAQGGLETAAPGGAGIYMGRAVNPNPEPNWSAAHKGLCVYVARLLQPVWENRVVGVASGGLLVPRFTPETLLVMEHKLQGLAAYVADLLYRRSSPEYTHSRSAASSSSAARGSSTSLGSTLHGLALNGSSAYNTGLGNGSVAGLANGGGGGGGGGGMFGTGRAGAGSGGMFGGGAASGVGGGGREDRGRGPAAEAQHSPAKRQRLMLAFQKEEECTAHVGALVAKAAEALFLLRILARNNLGRLTARLDAASVKSLTAMTLRELVYGKEGQSIATKLISVMVTEALEAGGAGAGGVGAVESVAGQLQSGCPTYFKDDDRTFYQASAKLKQAEGASSSAERDSLTSEAVASLRLVPLSCNLPYLVSQLVYLNNYEGIVEIPLRAAAASDPEGLALRRDARVECTRARARRESCYSHILGVLTSLTDGSPVAPPAAALPGGGPADGSASAARKAPTAAERVVYQKRLLRAAVASPDIYFHNILYSALLDLGAQDQLLSLETPHLELYLLEEGGLAAIPSIAASVAGGVGGVDGFQGEGAYGGGSRSVVVATATVGPLTGRQVQQCELLAKIMVGGKRFHDAADVYSALAQRRCGPADGGVTLAERVTWLQSAVLQARSSGDSAMVDTIESSARLAALQKSAVEQLTERAAASSQPAPAAPSAAAAAAAAGSGPAPSSSPQRSAPALPQASAQQLSELNSSLLDVSSLYNDFAQPLALWGLCLRLVHFAGGPVEEVVVRTLWDNTLLQAWNGPAAAGRSDRAALQMESVCSLVAALGGDLYPNEDSFPVAHVAFRLEQIAAALWPQANAVARPCGDAVAVALRRACRHSLPAVQRAYERLFSRRTGLGQADAELSATKLRAQLLRSLTHHCRATLKEISSGSPSGGIAALAQSALNPAGTDGSAAAASAAPPAAYPNGSAALSGGPMGRLRDAGSLIGVCERFAMEAGRLGSEDAGALAAEFGEIKRQAESLR
ncbi:MAG: hypothetical protein WDW36_008046 [Sanguina aurantia]